MKLVKLKFALTFELFSQSPFSQSAVPLEQHQLLVLSSALRCRKQSCKVAVQLDYICVYYCICAFHELQTLAEKVLICDRQELLQLTVSQYYYKMSYSGSAVKEQMIKKKLLLSPPFSESQKLRLR